ASPLSGVGGGGAAPARGGGGGPAVHYGSACLCFSVCPWRWRGAARGVRPPRRPRNPPPFRGRTRVSDIFHYRGGDLYAEELPVAHIAAAVGTPFYLYSAAG